MLYPAVAVLIVGSIGLAAYARSKVQGTVRRFRQVPGRVGLSGREVAEYVLRAGGVDGVEIQQVDGFLSDHYDPRNRQLRLSADVYSGRDLAAFGIAAHEAGHAIQHATGYTLLGLRSFTAPLAQLGGTLGFPLAIVGASLRLPPLMVAGLLLFALVVLFQLLTLPVELDASRRAVNILRGSGLVETQEEEMGVRSVLSSAALTYLAAAVTGIASLAQFALRLFGRRF
ncbi:MAG: zinc metallopeptidase [Planctomycetes bacterium]|nr:zinc metallopeptidase [Planctomycetota bacterium]